jgi:hypothetical protein
MCQKSKKPEGVKESHAVYRVKRKHRDRKTMDKAIEFMDQFQKRHENDPRDGKDSVTLIREDRDR